MKKDLINAGREGREVWPPSYAEFIGFAQPEKAPAGAYKVFAKSLPVPPEVKERRKKIALEKCASILSILDDKGDG